MKRIVMMLAIMLAVTYHGFAQDDWEAYTKAQQWYADRSRGVVLRFEGLRSHAGLLPQQYCIFPYKQAAPLGYAMVIATMDESEMVMFTPDGDGLKAQRVKKDVLPKGDVYWEHITYLGRNCIHATDITLKDRPLPVRSLNKRQNSFEVVIEGDEEIPNIKAYNQMIFKPHKNGVRLANQNVVKKTDDEGNITKNQKEYEFKLNTPSVVDKMFRGYQDVEASPWVVKSSFFNNHTLLQYSRWKEGEPVKKASKDVCRAITNYYQGWRIKDTRWLATTESGERSFYAVQFETKGTEALAAMVCLDLGEVASVWEFFGKVEPNASDGLQSIWFVDDEGDFMGHAPEIHCIVETDEGMELYVRQFGGESVQYSILREMGKVWMTMLTDYWIYVWD